MSDAAFQQMSVEEFLRWEDRQEPKYELVDGRPVMMTGGTAAQGDLRGNIYTHFRQGLRGRPCRPHLDLKVICGNANVRYPDVQVDCGPTLPKDVKASRPTVVVEVVSPSSRATDYMAKVRDYGTVASITTYLIVSQEDRQVTVLRRIGALLEMEAVLEGAEDVVDLPEAGLTLPLAVVYDDDGPSGAVPPLS